MSPPSAALQWTSGSLITARYGFVGGVAGSNNGTITGSGSKKALVSDDKSNTRPCCTG